jgi:hypothetical protein
MNKRRRYLAKRRRALRWIEAQPCGMRLLGAQKIADAILAYLKSNPEPDADADGKA